MQNIHTSTKQNKINNLTDNYYYALSLCNNTLLETVTTDCNVDSTAILNSGTSKSYMKINLPLLDLHPVNDGEVVILPNSGRITSTHLGYILIQNLSRPAQEADVFPGLTQSALISIGQLCDDGCTVEFDKKWARIYRQYELIMKGKHNFRTGMYNKVNLHNLALDKEKLNHSPPILSLPLTHSTSPNLSINNLYHLTKTRDVIQYLH